MGCGFGHGKAFPAIPVIMIVLGVFWLLSDLGLITANVPWFPIILVVVGVGWLVDYYKKDSA